MKMRVRGWKSPRVRLIAYAVVMAFLVALSIYQLYTIWISLDEARPVRAGGGTLVDSAADLITPYEMYISAEDPERFVRITPASGDFDALSQASCGLIRAVAQSARMQEISEEELPDGRGVAVLRYRCQLEERALFELLDLNVPAELRFQEIRLLPATSRQEETQMYLIDWENARFFRVVGQLRWGDAANQDFRDIFYAVSDRCEAEWLEGRLSFPEVFDGGAFVREKERETVLYRTRLTPSFTDAEGSFAKEEAADYAMHFFEHPDIVKEIGEVEDGLWYADEKRTVRMDENGHLQYVETPEHKDQTELSLAEAYRLAVGFLREDLASDKTRVQEVCLGDYEVTEEGYRFYFHYLFDGVPLLTSVWEDGYPVTITVENGVVRGYERYLIDKSMRADDLVCVTESYIDAVNTYRSMGKTGRIRQMELVYTEDAGELALSVRLLSDGEWTWIPVKEAYR